MSATVQSRLQINNGKLVYVSQPQSFNPTVTGVNGPTPGTVSIPTTGTDISFIQLDSMGGLCRIMNIDSTNFITVGVRDSNTNVFYPLTELLPGESYIFRLSRKLGKDEVGTGTFSGSNVKMHAIADTAKAILLVEAFDP